MSKHVQPLCSDVEQNITMLATALVRVLMLQGDVNNRCLSICCTAWFLEGPPSLLSSASAAMHVHQLI